MTLEEKEALGKKSNGNVAVEKVVPTKSKNFDIPANMDIQEFIKNEMAKERKLFEAKQAKLDMNKIAIGLTVLSSEVREGGVKLDKKNNNQPMVDGFGEPLRYPSNYYVDFAFMGGSIRTEVKAEQFSSLVPMQKYFCKGYLGAVTEFGKTEIKPIFFEFESLSS